ncbi:putative mannosyltransferase 1, partial [Operophtera brumata]
MLIGLSGKLTGYDGKFPFEKPVLHCTGRCNNSIDFSHSMLSWQLFLGAALACTVSVKFVGLFVVLFSLTVEHLVGRSITLIVWPAILYIFFFWIHLTVLNRSAPDRQQPAQCQRAESGRIRRHHNPEEPQDWWGVPALSSSSVPSGGGRETTAERVDGVVVVRSGDLVRLTHAQTARNVHSHRERAPLTTKYLQVTGYGETARNVHSHRERAPLTTKYLQVTGYGETARNVHSHRERAPLTTKYLQVTGYGEDGIGDANDVWKIVISGGKDGDEILTVRSKLMFVHYLQGNAGLKPKEGELTSQPWQWPINYRV